MPQAATNCRGEGGFAGAGRAGDADEHPVADGQQFMACGRRARPGRPAARVAPGSPGRSRAGRRPWRRSTAAPFDADVRRLSVRRHPAPSSATLPTAAACLSASLALRSSPAARAFAACARYCSTRLRNCSTRADCLRVGAPPVPVVGGLDACPRPRAAGRRTRGCAPAAPCRRPPSVPGWTAASPWRASRPVAGSIFSASSRSFSFIAALASNSASRSENVLFRREKKASWAARNRAQSASSTSRGARPAAFHSSIRLAVRGGRVAPVGGVRQRLGRGDQRLLRLLRGAALLVELGEMRAAVPGEGVARLGEPLPQRVVGLPVDAADRAATPRRWPSAGRRWPSTASTRRAARPRRRAPPWP